MSTDDDKPEVDGTAPPSGGAANRGQAPTVELTGKQIAEKLAALTNKPAVTGEVVDDVTRAELERWFGLPSYTQIEEGDIPKGAEPIAIDPEVAAVRERRERAIAAVDPRMLDEMAARAQRLATPRHERPEVVLHVREDMPIADLDAIERGHRIAEPREVELPVEMQDDLKTCAPQALLRDLHRPELEFEKTFEIVDMAADQKMDIVALVDEAMRTAWRLTGEDVARSPKAEATAAIAEIRAERRRPWPKLWTARPLPNRTVSE